MKRGLPFSLLVALLSIPSSNATALEFVVTTTADSGSTSLRGVIERANAVAGPHRISFRIGGGRKTICPLEPLPAVTEPVLIDGWTQPGWNRAPIIELSGACALAGNGLVIEGGNSQVRGLVINGWSGNGLTIRGPGGNVAYGLFVGVDFTGKIATPNAVAGISIDASNDNRVGGTTEAGINVLSGNGSFGVLIVNGATDNRVIHSLIGTDAAGRTTVPNGRDGVRIARSSHNTIGGIAAVFRNTISGNLNYGLTIDGPDSTSNTVIGNYIGLNRTGSQALPNKRTGVLIFNTPGNTLDRNVISGNLRAGINIDGSAFRADELPYVGLGLAKLNVVTGNLIGLDAKGRRAIPNGLAGVRIFKAQQNAIRGNVISGNAEDGIIVQSDPERTRFHEIARWNRIDGNRIGLAANDDRPVPNGRYGVLVMGDRNHIGASTRETGNVIRFNKSFGLYVRGPDYQTNTNSGHNTITGNTRGNVIYRP